MAHETAGQKLADPLRKSGYFPPDVVEMITIAEEANSLETVLIQVADSLEEVFMAVTGRNIEQAQEGRPADVRARRRVAHRLG